MYTRRGILRVVHTIRHKQKLIVRVRRLQGQLQAVERAVAEERGCEDVIRTISAARGAINALAAEVLCDHIDEHLGARRVPATERAQAASEVARLIREFVG